MDRVLKDVGLDLKFTIYNLIAFTMDDGLLQFVPNSETITKIKKKYNNSIENYLKDCNLKPDEKG
jgi:phosphatidylinositol kinase/protein kinase (PI-3  family)